MRFSDLDAKLQTGRVPLAICMPEDVEAILAAKEASDLGYVECLFVGNPDVMKPLLEKETPGFSPGSSKPALPKPPRLPRSNSSGRARRRR